MLLRERAQGIEADGEKDEAFALRDLTQAREVAHHFTLHIAQAPLRCAGELDLPAGFDRQTVHLPGVHFDDRLSLVEQIDGGWRKTRENALNLNGVEPREVALRVVAEELKLDAAHPRGGRLRAAP